MADVLRDLGVVVDHPTDGVYEVAAGDVDWLFVPLEAAAKMRASFILLGPLLARFGRVIISNPGGDRIGRRPVNLHVDAMRALGADIEYRNGYYYAQAPGRLRGAEVQAAPGDRDGHRERDARGDPRRRPHGHPAGRAGAGDRRPHHVPVRDGRGRQADVPRHDRGQRHAPAARRHALGDARPDRDRHVPRRRRRHRRDADPRERRLRPRRRRSSSCSTGSACRCAATSARSRSTPPGCGPGDLRAQDIETAPYPGLATDLQPPTCVLLTQANGTSHVHETIFEDRIEGLAELRKLGRADRHPRHPSRRHPRPGAAPRRRGHDRRPAGRRHAHPRRPRRRRVVAHPRRAPRPAGV